MHLALSKIYWKNLLKSDDNVIDATCGRGKDSLFLAKILKKGKLFCFDIQKEAIDSSYLLLKRENIDLKRIYFYNQSHVYFSKIPDKIKLIVYNLGYLPGGKKFITTERSTTLKSIKNSLSLVERKGAVSITCYPKHQAGEKETLAILGYLRSVARDYFITIHRGKSPLSPLFIWIEKI